MEKFIPYEKLSKKEKRKMDLAKRQTWCELNPVTRKPENSKAYNRNKARNWKREHHEPVPGHYYLFFSISYYTSISSYSLEPYPSSAAASMVCTPLRLSMRSSRWGLPGSEQAYTRSIQA